ncbi:hypothetical protein QBC39DRAFT_57855 [Podospora conica]|nr:hypothetical protein QBC39DRAFT_57855 [Schizothecium conicum]
MTAGSRGPYHLLVGVVTFAAALLVATPPRPRPPGGGGRDTHPTWSHSLRMGARYRRCGAGSGRCRGARVRPPRNVIFHFDAITGP